MLKDYGHRFTRRASILDIYIYKYIISLSLSWYRDSTLYAKIRQQFISTEKLTGGLPYYIFLVSTSGEITFSGHE